jgi:probable addiction module antidote protein
VDARWALFFRTSEGFGSTAAEQGKMARARTSAPDPRFGTPESIAAFLNEAFETNDPALIARTIGVVARAKGMSEISRKINRSREALYRSFDGTTKAEFVAIVQVLDVLGLRLVAKARAPPK